MCAAHLHFVVYVDCFMNKFKFWLDYLLIHLGVNAVGEWMVIYPHVLVNLARLSSGLLLQGWKILLRIKSCKPLRMFNWMDYVSHISSSPHVFSFSFSFHSLLFRCAIYRLPDAHEHITRPPTGVSFPNKVCGYYWGLVARSLRGLFHHIFSSFSATLIQD